MADLDILIGGEQFREIREHHYCYVDKTAFLEELCCPLSAKMSVITRPRRFGKTLTMMMLQEFFDIRKDSRDIFAGLAVAQNEDFCNAWMNKFPTVFITLKGVEGRTFELACGSMVDLLQEIAISHSYLLTSEKIDSDDRKRLQVIKNRQCSEIDMTNALKLSCRTLEAYWRKPAILLIDEYDVPVACAEQNGYLGEMIACIRSLLGGLLTTNPSVQFALLTGCLPIAKESIFTGFNNCMYYSVSDTEYADTFGFTPQEVDDLLAAARLPYKKQECKTWYLGYRFGENIEIYCPWDILLHINKVQRNQNARPKAYWNSTSGNTIIRTLLQLAGDETREKIEALLS